MRALLTALLLAGCAAPAAQRATTQPFAPEALQSCPGAAHAPVPPPAPRSVAALLSYAVQADRARAADANALAECARKLNALNNWLVEMQSDKTTEVAGRAGTN